MYGCSGSSVVSGADTNLLLCAFGGFASAILGLSGEEAASYAQGMSSRALRSEAVRGPFGTSKHAIFVVAVDKLGDGGAGLDELAAMCGGATAMVRLDALMDGTETSMTDVTGGAVELAEPLGRLCWAASLRMVGLESSADDSGYLPAAGGVTRSPLKARA